MRAGGRPPRPAAASASAESRRRTGLGFGRPLRAIRPAGVSTLTGTPRSSRPAKTFCSCQPASLSGCVTTSTSSAGKARSASSIAWRGFGCTGSDTSASTARSEPTARAVRSARSCARPRASSTSMNSQRSRESSGGAITRTSASGSARRRITASRSGIRASLKTTTRSLRAPIRDEVPGFSPCQTTVAHGPGGTALDRSGRRWSRRPVPPSAPASSRPSGPPLRSRASVRARRPTRPRPRRACRRSPRRGTARSSPRGGRRRIPSRARRRGTPRRWGCS